MKRYFDTVAQIARDVSVEQIDAMAAMIEGRRDGRLFILGVGGGAGNASHAVSDFRKLCRIEAYAPTDNVSELTARTNDEGWTHNFSGWLKVSRLSERDAVLVFSVGGGSLAVSANLAVAIQRAKHLGAAILGIVGSPDGVLAHLADVTIIIDAPADLRTPLVESFQSVIWHALVNHPTLRRD